MKRKNIISTLIISFILSLSIIWDSYEKTSNLYISYIIVFILSFPIVYYIFNLTEKYNLKKPKRKISKKEYIIYSILIITVLIFSILAFYPGIMIPDTIDQWKQVQTGIYKNWHPVIQTLYTFKLPTLFYNGIISSTIFQCFNIYLILLYFCYTMRKHFLSFKQTIFVLLLIILNPIFIKFNMFLWKDTIYSWFLFLETLVLINIVIEKDNFFKNNKNKFLLIFGSLGILLFRHNGIIPYALIFIALIIYYKNARKFLTVSFISITALYFIITGPIYKALDIKGNGGKAEMVGVVMSNISYYYNNQAEFTSEELKLLNKVVPLNILVEKYNPQNFNSTKWATKNFNLNLGLNFNKIIKLWIKKTFHNPKMFVKSYLSITSPIWKTDNYFKEIDYSKIVYTTKVSSKGKLKNVSNQAYNVLLNYNNTITKSPFRWLFVDFGGGLLLIIFALTVTIKKSKLSIKKWIPFIPVLANTAVIMLLITGEEVRFVYSQVICVMPLLIYSLSLYIKEKSESGLEKTCKKLFINPTENSMIQFLRYIFVGGIAAIVNIGMLYIFTEIFGIFYIVSNILSFILGLIVNYTLSKKLVFQNDTNISKQKEFIIYGIIGILGLILDTLIISMLVTHLKMYYMLGKILSTIIVFIWNFVARKIFYKIIN